MADSYTAVAEMPGLDPEASFLAPDLPESAEGAPEYLEVEPTGEAEVPTYEADDINAPETTRLTTAELAELAREAAQPARPEVQSIQEILPVIFAINAAIRDNREEALIRAA
jgi:hypothetical protein